MELPVKKGYCLPKMSTRARRKVVAGDRARRPNVPWHMSPGVRVRENVVANTGKMKYTKLSKKTHLRNLLSGGIP